MAITVSGARRRGSTRWHHLLAVSAVAFLSFTLPASAAQFSTVIYLECTTDEIAQVSIGLLIPPSATSAEFGPGCTATDCALATELGVTIDPSASSATGPGLASPPGVRSDTLYIQTRGNGPLDRLCSSFQTVVLGRVIVEDTVEPPGFVFTTDGVLALYGVGPLLDTFGAGVSSGFLNASACGNALLEPGEECDTGGESPTCDVDCTFRICGDGLTNASAGEQCDDAGESPTCDVDCTFAVCGDATQNGSAGEQCDDGGIPGPDCCGVACQFEPPGNSCSDGTACTESDQCDGGGVCSGSPLTCVDGNICTTDTCDAGLGCQFLPVPDSDADGACDTEDNCPFISNPGWPDNGGLLGAVPDGIGDACQCGEVTGDGILDNSDVLAMQENLVGNVPLGAHAPRCNVVGPPDGGISDCGVDDISALIRGINLLATKMAQVCLPATAP